MASSSYSLVAGAAFDSANPDQVNPASTANLTVAGPKAPETETIAGAPATIDEVEFEIESGGNLLATFQVGQPGQPGASGLDTLVQSLFPAASGDTDVSLPAPFSSVLQSFAAANPGAVSTVDGINGPEIDMPLSTFAQFVAQDGTALAAGNVAPGGGGATTTINIDPQTVIRTGTGSIALLAPGNVDLTGGPTVQYLDFASNTLTTAPPTGGAASVVTEAQVGGAAVYTAGHPVDLVPETLTDPVTGLPVTVDPTSFLPATTVDPTQLSLQVGVPTSDPVLLEGGGDIDISAGQNVLGRRDLSLEAEINQAGGSTIPGIGSAAEPWRVELITDTGVTSEINPAVFRSGVGALGGGNIKIDAGQDVSDLTVDTDHSEIPATATPATGAATLAELSFGSGNLDVAAGQDILGGNFEIADGTAVIRAGQDIAGGPQSVDGLNQVLTILPNGQAQFSSVQTFFPNPVQLSLDDATISLSAGGSIALQAITALGSADSGPSNDITTLAQLDEEGLYSPHSGVDLLADGGIAIANGIAAGSDLNIGSVAGVYPASFDAASITGDLDITVAPPSFGATALNLNQAPSIELVPSAVGS